VNAQSKGDKPCQEETEPALLDKGQEWAKEEDAWEEIGPAQVPEEIVYARIAEQRYPINRGSLVSMWSAQSADHR